uniref:Uncharacterized protein n=1 Tax=Salix viminalis TaxID=40686 RepID=A0A6N2KTT7_SALVM
MFCYKILRGNVILERERGKEMGMLGMRFFILSSFERKGMGFHEAFLPKKGNEVRASLPCSVFCAIVASGHEFCDWNAFSALAKCLVFVQFRPEVLRKRS